MSTALPPVRGRRVPNGSPRALTLAAVVLLAAVLAVLLIGSFSNSSSPTISGSGVAATQTRSLPHFRSVDVTGFSNLTVQAGTRQSVVVSADDNIVGRITTRVVSGNLVIGNKPGSYTVTTPVVVHVVIPSVAALALEGTGHMTASGIHTGELTLSLAGFGTIHASGSATRLRVTLSGEGVAELAQLTARDATAVIDGNGEIRLTATNSLSATISGSGEIRYRGTPAHLTRSVTGSGVIGPG